MGNKNRRARKVYKFMRRKERKLRFFSIIIFSVGVALICCVAVGWYLSLPVAHVSVETGKIVAVEDGATGKEIPQTGWSNVLRGTYNSVYVP